MGQSCFQRIIEPGETKEANEPKVPGAEPGATRNVMGKYVMFMKDDDTTGEGTSSICRRGKIMASTAMKAVDVAVKVYKTNRKKDAVTLTKFRRQIEVLQMLKEPLVEPQDPTLWCEFLKQSTSEKLFMQLIDFSTDKSGEPGPDPDDKQMYVITELGSYSLKDYLKGRRDEKKPLSKDSVWDVTKAVMLVTAGLHAKGLVHLDLKPENLMLFNGCMKLIDVDGCVKIGTTVAVNDSSLSFSPCYCAPEWAAFLIEDVEEPTIKIQPGLDVWSIGMTIAEVVTLEPLLRQSYAGFMRHGRSHREAGFFFMDWLATLKKVPFPKTFKDADPQLLDMLENNLLVCDVKDRQTLAQTMSHKYITNHTRRKLGKARTGPIQDEPLQQIREFDHDNPPALFKRKRLEDHAQAVMFKGTLNKLNTGGNVKDIHHWQNRDMWIANNGSLSYFSQKEGKRLVLLDGHQVHDAIIEPVDGGVKEFAFRMKVQADEDHDAVEMFFACDTEKEYKVWLHELEQSQHRVAQSMHLGTVFASDRRIAAMRLAIKNRRLKIGDDPKQLYAPVFKGVLWKVKTDGDKMNKETWFPRDTWVSANGSLAYHSKKEDRDLVYYEGNDVQKATISKIPDDQSAMPFAFQIVLPPDGEMEFTPGEFAAESEDMRQQWMDALSKPVLTGSSG